MNQNSTKKDIIVFTAGIGNCGIQRVLSELTNEWIENGHTVKLVYMYTDASKKKRATDFVWRQEIELIGIKRTKLFSYIVMFFSYLQIMKKNPKAIAVSLSVRSNYVVGACSLFTNNKIIVSDRNDPQRRPKEKMKQLIRDYAFRRADVIILQTEDVQQYYEQRIHRKGVIIPNPINRDISHISIPNSRRPVIVTASRLNAQKNLGMLIDAFDKFCKQHSEYTLEIYGRGEEAEKLQSKVKTLGLSEKVIFKGFSNDLYHEIVDASIYVCSSDYEGISNSLLEALGLGIPTISTDCPIGGSRLLIDNNVNGILIPVGDVEELYNQMERIATHPELADFLSKNALDVREKYRVDQIAQLWIDNM